VAAPTAFRKRKVGAERAQKQRSLVPRPDSRNRPLSSVTASNIQRTRFEVAMQAAPQLQAVAPRMYKAYDLLRASCVSGNVLAARPGSSIS
jgi:hypothetical protein